MTALSQLKWIKIGLKSSENILVLSDLPQAKAIEVFESCDIPKEIYDNCVFVQTNAATMNPEEVFVYLKENVIQQNSIKAVLLDTELFSALEKSVKDYLGLNVWDMHKLMGYIFRAVCQHPRNGFI